ncbi:MAG: hypothetical protein NVSMB16_15210 [Acidimicrobiales bacterium]
MPTCVGSLAVLATGYERRVPETRVDASTRHDAEVLRRQRVARWATAACLAGAAGLTVILLATVQGTSGSATDAGRVPAAADATPAVPGTGGSGAVTPAGVVPPAVEPPAPVPATARPPLKTSSGR